MMASSRDQQCHCQKMQQFLSCVLVHSHSFIYLASCFGCQASFKKVQSCGKNVCNLGEPVSVRLWV